MIENRFENPFVFENFSARAADDLLPVEFIKYKDPSVADKVTVLSNGMINIKGITELSYAGVPKELPDFSFSNQKEGFYGKNIGYFRFNIISPYPEAESVVYVINNDKQFTYNLVDRTFEIDHPIAERKDGVNWTPINWGTQNLLIKFIDKTGKELGVKTLVISNSPIKQQQPNNFIADNIKAGLLFPVEVLNPAIADGSINFGDIILKTDGSTDKKDLILSKDQPIGLTTNRYLGFSLKITEPYSSIAFFINGQDMTEKSDIFVISPGGEKVDVYFAVAKDEGSKKFVPYYESPQNFELVVRTFKDTKISSEEKVNFSFNVMKESNALSKEFILIKEPKGMESFAKVSNGLIDIKNLGELGYNGTLSNFPDFSFDKQEMGYLKENVGYFRAIISNPYPEADYATWSINGSGNYSHSFSSAGSSFPVDFALAVKSDKANWTPVGLTSQNLSIRFFDSKNNVLAEKEVNVSIEEIKQQQPYAVKSGNISSRITPYTIMNVSDGKVDISEIILNKDGSTNFKELNLAKEQGIGNSGFRYLDYSFSLTDEEVKFSHNLSFFINGNSYNPESGDYIIQYDKEKRSVNVYFAVAEINDAKQLIPYYNEAAKSFSMMARFKDDNGLIFMEKIVSTTFNLSDGSVQSDLEAFPAKQFLFNNESLSASNGEIGFGSNTFFYRQEKGDYLVDGQLNNKYLFPKDLEYMKELSPSCRYVRFTLSLNSEKPKLNSLKYSIEGKDYDYNFLDQNNNSLYVFNREQEIDFYYPVTCYIKGKTVDSSYWKNNVINQNWKIDYLDEATKKNYQYYFNVNLSLSGVCKKSDQLIELPIEAFYFDDEYLNKYSQKKSGFLYYNYPISQEMQKKYINQNVSEFSKLDYLRYFKVNFKPFEIKVKDSSLKSGYTIKKFNYSRVENINEFPKTIISGKDHLYFLAFDYYNKKLNPYSLDHGLILNLVDDSCNIYSSKFQIVSKPIIEEKVNPSTPVVETKPVVPEYKETYNPITGELIKEKINPENENLTTPSKEEAKVIDAKLLTEAQMVDRSPKEEVKVLLLTSVNVEKPDSELEKKVEVKHQSLLVGASTPEVKTSLKNYLAYGTESTVRLGEGQRAATVINYTSVKGAIPQTESDIEDVLKIANNRVPLIRNSELEPKFLGNFYRLNNIIKENDITKIDEDNLILELNQFLRFSYGILPMERSIAKEKWAIELFVKNYNKLPQTDGEWRIVNSWAYRNVLISQVENNLEWINSISSENPEITVELLDKFFELAVK